MKVVIIDDQKAMHYILSRMLSKMEQVEIVGSFQDTTTAYSYIMTNNVDLVFVDINMPRENGLDFAKRLRKNGWIMKLVFVTSHKEYALPAFDVYAYDYIVKPISQERLRGTIDRALSEEIVQKGEVIVASLEKSLSSVEPLTKREIEVLQLMSNGMTNREIAAAFELTEGTVKNHIVNIFGKLQVKNRVQATAMLRNFS
jgi:DNA-binding NarL/FixJ family response regulator